MRHRSHTLSEGPLPARLAAVILELAVMHGHEAGLGGIVEVEPPVTFEDLAGLTGTTVESVSRLITVWHEAGAVFRGTGRRRLSLYPERLRDIVWRSGGL